MDYYSPPTDAGLAALGCFFWLAIAAISLAVAAFVIFCWWRICAKAGYGGAMSLLVLLPGVGMIILLCILAFGRWPIHSCGNRQMGGPTP